MNCRGSEIKAGISDIENSEYYFMTVQTLYAIKRMTDRDGW